MPLEVSLLGISFKESMYVIKWLQCRCLLVDTGKPFLSFLFFPSQSTAKEQSFSWFYLCMNVGQLMAEGGFPVARQTAGFVVSFLIATGWYAC